MSPSTSLGAAHPDGCASFDALIRILQVLMKLFFKEYGTGSPLIILHGLLGSLDNWHTLSTNFGRSFRVIAVDQRNHGRSPHDEVMTYEAMANDLHELCEVLRISPVLLMGHSMGGKTAMQFAAMFPDNVEKLIVVDIAPRAYPAHHDEILDALMSVDLGSMQERQDVDAALARRIVSLPVRQFLMKNLTRTPEGQFLWKANIPVLQRKYGHLAAAVELKAPFRKPTLFVRGTRSEYVADTDLPALSRIFPEVQIANVDAGHWVHAEAPAEFSETVLRFLNSPR